MVVLKQANNLVYSPLDARSGKLRIATVVARP